jgi:hypothetical protein
LCLIPVAVFAGWWPVFGAWLGFGVICTLWIGSWSWPLIHTTVLVLLGPIGLATWLNDVYLERD